MADIRLKIEVNPEAGITEVIGDVGIEYTQTTANTSIKTYDFIKTSGNDNFLIFKKLPEQNDGAELMSFAKPLVFNEIGMLSNQESLKNGQLGSENNSDYFVFGDTDENGKLSVKLGLYAENGKVLEDIILIGNKKAGQFPTKAILDGDIDNPIYSDDNKWTIKFKNSVSEHTIEFLEWNRPNYNAMLTYIGVTMKFLELSKEHISNISSLNQSNPDETNIYYGVIANSGRTSIIDYDGEIADLVNDGVINNSDTRVDLTINGNQIATHITTDSTYNSNGNELELSLTNTIEYLNKLKYKGYLNVWHKDMPLYYILFDIIANYWQTINYKNISNLQDATKEFDSILSNNVFYNNDNTQLKISDYLKLIIVKYPYIESGVTYAEAINRVCQVAQLQSYQNENGELRFISARPIVSKTQKPIIVKGYDMFSSIEHELFLKNKYDRIELSEYKTEEQIDYNTLIETLNINSLSFEKDENITKFRVDSFKSADLLSSISVLSINDATYKYYIGEEIIKYEDGLSRNISISNWDNLKQKEIPYTITYLRKIKNATGNVHFDKDNNTISYNGEINITDSEYTDHIVSVSGVQISNYDASGTAEYGGKIYSFNIPLIDVSPSENKLTINLINDWQIEYKIGCFSKILHLQGANGGAISSEDFNMSGVEYEYIPQTLEISFYGNKKTIKLTPIDVSEQTSDLYNTTLALNTNTLIQSNTMINDTKISTQIKNNIFNDYKNGVRTCKVKIAMNNLYYEDGTLVKDFKKGEILSVGDIIKFKLLKPNNYGLWRILGAEYIYEDAPYINLTLMEVKKV